MSVFLYSQNANFGTLRSLAFGSVSGTYANVGAAFTDRTKIVQLYNGLDAAVTVSFSGGTDHMVMAAGAVVQFDLKSNNLNLGTEHRVQIKGTVTSGTFYVTELY